LLSLLQKWRKQKPNSWENSWAWSTGGSCAQRLGNGLWVACPYLHVCMWKRASLEECVCTYTNIHTSYKTSYPHKRHTGPTTYAYAGICNNQVILWHIPWRAFRTMIRIRACILVCTCTCLWWNITNTCASGSLFFNVIQKCMAYGSRRPAPSDLCRLNNANHLHSTFRDAACFVMWRRFSLATLFGMAQSIQ
jgi:hypothetical protein